MQGWLMTGVLFLLAAAVSHSAAAPLSYSARLFDSGEVVSLAALRGQPILLTSWATWCTECKAMLPALEEIWKTRKAQGLLVIAVNLDGPGSQRGARAMITRYGLTMPVWRDRDNAYASTFQAIGVPTSVLLDSQGRLTKMWVGRLDLHAPEVQQAIATVLESLSSSAQR